MMRALIVDDEIHAREELEALLRESGSFVLVSSCANAVEALHAVRSERPDVLFLDIRMPKVDGFQLLSMLDEEIMPNVVFVTAYDEYALKAFEANALDYLLKPIDKNRLAKAIEKLKRYTSAGERPTYTGPAIERIPCLSGPSVKLVDAAEVEFVRSNEAGVYVVLPQGEFFTELTLKVLESKTPLARCHKQFLVNLQHVDQIVRQGPSGVVLRMKSGKDVPVSRRLLGRLKELLGVQSRRGSPSENEQEG